ncbi:MAG: hypothetical protein AB7F43_11755 [Bacteriovoracia bacterium]
MESKNNNGKHKFITNRRALDQSREQISGVKDKPPVIEVQPDTEIFVLFK